MLEFKIAEIPEGSSFRTCELTPNDLDLGNEQFKGGSVNFEFSRNDHFIKANFSTDVVVELVCDRSLESFDYAVRKDYEVLFKAEPTEEHADEHGAVRNYDYVTNSIDLEEDVRDTILLSLPIKKLHPRFLDEHGEPKELVKEQFGISEDEDFIDPRWEALKKLKK